MAPDTPDRRGYGFLIGLFTGTAVGAGLAMWLAPRAASELRQRVADSAKALGNRAAARYQNVNARVADTVVDLAKRGQRVRDDVADAVGDLAKKGQRVRDDMADAVARGAHEVERIAIAAKTDGR